MTKEEKQWLAWFLGSLGVFIYLESKAIRRKNSGGTLTAATRKALGLYPPKPWRLAGAAGFVAFFGWFVAHIVTGDFVPKPLRTKRD